MVKSNQDQPWTPNRQTSQGATAYHDAVVNTTWHKENINELIKIVKDKIVNNDIVVDFGAGTGSSALYILEYIKTTFSLFLVDNSPSWLGKAYELLNSYKNVVFLLLERKKDRYITLDELLGKESVDHVISGNTVHLIPNIEEVFYCIYNALKKQGTFTFQSGNIAFSGRTEDILMIDNSINEIHDIALEIIRTDRHFNRYKKDLDQRIEQQKQQRAFVFPSPRSIEHYLQVLQSIGFKNIKVTYKQITVNYTDWL